MPFLAAVMPGLKKGGGICCGMGGILKLTDPELSRDMAKDCLAGMPSGALGGTGVILTGCGGCAIQLAAHAEKGVAVRHWLDAADCASGLPGRRPRGRQPGALAKISGAPGGWTKRLYDTIREEKP